jgi:glutamine synthetase
MENYCKTLNIEALTMLEMTKKEIIPAVCAYIRDLTDTALAKKALSAEINCELEEDLVKRLSCLSGNLYKKVGELEAKMLEIKNYSELVACAKYYRDIIFIAMQELRAVADEIELLVGEKYWPFPTYGDLLFGV